MTVARNRRRGVFVGAASLLLISLLAGCADPEAQSSQLSGSADASAGSSSVSAGASESASSARQQESTESPAASATSDGLSLDEYSTSDPTSLWVVVNKQRPFDPLDWAPDDLVTVTLNGSTGQLRSEAGDALTALAQASDQDTGEQMTIRSSYRSYDRQVTVYDGWVSQYGQEEADTISARPGYSEHQTGLVVDIAISTDECTLNACFADTATGAWVAENAWQFGFIVRYPEGRDATTGYVYEPWHLRYVGTDLAAYMHSAGISTLEDVFGLGDAADY